jgi:energy-coupling factor transporter ATP-binding protein EcfA2
MINSLHVRNFKGIRRADIGLERLTVIVGPNASGKTSILEGLHYLSDLGTIESQGLFNDRRDPLLLHRRGAIAEKMELSCSGSRGEARIRIAPPNGSSDPWILLFGDEKEAKFDREQPPRHLMLSKGFPEFARKLSPAELLRLDVARMTDPTVDDDDRMKSDGAGLAAALVFMALNQPDDFQHIQEQLRAVVPTVERIRFDRIKLDKLVDNKPIKKYRILFDFRGARDIPAHLASEGTILVLGLLTALMGQGRPDIILLDDLDRGLHPKAQREVVGLIRTILDQNPDLQIIATTHSPYLVDNLRPEEVRLTTLAEDGTVSIAGLVDHPDFDKWKDEMAPGEMWSLFGEKWVSEVNQVAGGE